MPKAKAFSTMEYLDHFLSYQGNGKVHYSDIDANCTTKFYDDQQFPCLICATDVEFEGIVRQDSGWHRGKVDDRIDKSIFHWFLKWFRVDVVTSVKHGHVGGRRCDGDEHSDILRFCVNCKVGLMRILELQETLDEFGGKTHKGLRMQIISELEEVKMKMEMMEDTFHILEIYESDQRYKLVRYQVSEWEPDLENLDEQLEENYRSILKKPDYHKGRKPTGTKKTVKFSLDSSVVSKSLQIKANTIMSERIERNTSVVTENSETPKLSSVQLANTEHNSNTNQSDTSLDLPFEIPKSTSEQIPVKIANKTKPAKLVKKVFQKKTCTNIILRKLVKRIKKKIQKKGTSRVSFITKKNRTMTSITQTLNTASPNSNALVGMGNADISTLSCAQKTNINSDSNSSHSAKSLKSDDGGERNELETKQNAIKSSSDIRVLKEDDEIIVLSILPPRRINLHKNSDQPKMEPEHSFENPTYSKETGTVSEKMVPDKAPKLKQAIVPRKITRKEYTSHLSLKKISERIKTKFQRKSTIRILSLMTKNKTKEPISKTVIAHETDIDSFDPTEHANNLTTSDEIESVPAIQQDIIIHHEIYNSTDWSSDFSSEVPGCSKYLNTGKPKEVVQNKVGNQNVAKTVKKAPQHELPSHSSFDTTRSIEKVPIQKPANKLEKVVPNPGGSVQQKGRKVNVETNSDDDNYDPNVTSSEDEQDDNQTAKSSLSSEDSSEKGSSNDDESDSSSEDGRSRNSSRVPTTQGHKKLRTCIPAQTDGMSTDTDSTSSEDNNSHDFRKTKRNKLKQMRSSENISTNIIKYGPIKFSFLEHKIKKVRCIKCKALVNLGEKSLRRHVIKFHTNRFLCPHCTYRARDKCELKMHIEVVHLGSSAAGKKKVKCKICGRMVDSLRNHEWTHMTKKEQNYIRKNRPERMPSRLRKKWECDECSKCFAFQLELKRHKETKHEVRSKPKSRCQVCGANVENIRDHMRNQHEKNERYECMENGCGRKFKLLSQMNMHKNSVHKKIRPKPWKCDKCKKVYSKKPSSKKHMCSNVGVCQWICAVVGCGEGFGKKKDLMEHHRDFHEGESD